MTIFGLKVTACFRYYDPMSNGYYYEQMGSRGWRRHTPAIEHRRLLMEQVGCFLVIVLVACQ